MDRLSLYRRFEHLKLVDITGWPREERIGLADHSYEAVVPPSRMRSTPRPHGISCVGHSAPSCPRAPAARLLRDRTAGKTDASRYTPRLDSVTRCIAGLIDLDLLLVDNVLLVLFLVALFVLLRPAGEVTMALASAAAVLDIALYVATDPTVRMASLSDTHAAATSDVDRVLQDRA